MDAEAAGNGAERRHPESRSLPERSAPSSERRAPWRIAGCLVALGLIAAACADDDRQPVRAIDARSDVVEGPVEPDADVAAEPPTTTAGASAEAVVDAADPVEDATNTDPPTVDDPALDIELVNASVSQFVETFDGNTGLDRFRYGVYHRGVAHHEAGTPMPLGADNNALTWGSWGADHDLDCGSPDTQRTLKSESWQDTSGANGWKPTLDLHTDELVYLCRDHLMTSMGDVGAYSIVWFAPDMVFDDVSSVAFDVNLTDLGNRQWWKVGVVSDTLYNSTTGSDWNGAVQVPGFITSDVGAAGLDGKLEGPDRMIATWSGGASAGYPGALKIGDRPADGGFSAGDDKRTRHPVALVDNQDGTVTFSVAGSSATVSGSFPECPCRVVFYDHNYTPDKDTNPIGHTWHWDNIIVG